MNPSISYPHLHTDETGTVRIGQTRYKVKHLAAEHYQHGWTAEELMRHHPDLCPAEVYSALAYFYDHYDGMLAEIQQSYQAALKAASPSPVSRAELLRRTSTAE